MPSPTSLARSSVAGRGIQALARFFQGRPFLGLFLVVLASNAFGSAFNILYNRYLIVERLLTPPQRSAFWNVALPLYNLLAYPACLAIMVWLLWPIGQAVRRMRRGEAVEPERMELGRRRLVNAPLFQLFVNFMGWIPGAVFFPWVICTVGGDDNAAVIWQQFAVSFIVSAIFTTVQTFFGMEAYLVATLYPEMLKDTRPADIEGVIRIPFLPRLIMLWMAIAVMPLLAVIAVVWNFGAGSDDEPLKDIAYRVTGIGILSGFFIFLSVGRDLQHWLNLHSTAHRAVSRGDFDVRIEEPRPDEWGLLTDSFNDMAAALGRGRQLRETFGQFVSPEVRDEILERIPGLEVVVQHLTVLFVDIRGFTIRIAGESPEDVGRLLNRFLTLALSAVEAKGGLVNKFLGDGVMALFGATRVTDDHADLAVACAQEMLARLEELNRELRDSGQPPLTIGVGIHTGPALVGCFGATIQFDDGRQRTRREFTAIGETVNYSQRLEQLTKEAGGPVLLSETTRLSLRTAAEMETLGPRKLPGSNEVMIVHRLTR